MKELVLAQLRGLCAELLRFCPDMLAGDFGPIQREGYWEFNTYYYEQGSKLYNRPYDDPLRMKLHAARGLGWVWDLWEQERPGEPLPPWWHADPR
jgi:hypothetical protein